MGGRGRVGGVGRVGWSGRVSGGGRESGWGRQGHGLNGGEVEGTSVPCSSVLAGQP